MGEEVALVGAEMNELLPACIAGIRFLPCVCEEVVPVVTEMISVVAALPAAMSSSLPHGVHLPPVLLQRGGRRQSHLTHVTAIAAA